MTEPKLSREAIIETATALADAEGLQALSMRRIAERMGVGTMSLYRHVPGKDELIAAMTDEVARRYPYPPAEGRGWNWRDRVHIAADIDWRLYQEHPWVLLTFATPRYSFGPQSLACMGWLVEGFGELGVSVREATRMTFTVWNYISGASLPNVSTALVRRRRADPGEKNGLLALLDGNPLWETPAALTELHGSGVDQLTTRESLHEGLETICDGFRARLAIPVESRRSAAPTQA